MMQLFWAEIASKIEDSFPYGPPSEWHKKEIELFLGVFIRKLREICRDSPRKRNLLIASKTSISGQDICNRLDLSYDTFRRIFITKEGTGAKSTIEMFSIFFGYESFQDFVFKNKLEEKIEVMNLSTKKAAENDTSELINSSEKVDAKKVDLDNIKAEENVTIKITQKINSSTSAKEIEAKGGSINIDIIQE